MGTTDKSAKEALGWLRFVLNPETAMPTVTDWPAVKDFAKKQALIGICRPQTRPDSLDEDLYLQWMVPVYQLERLNLKLTKRIELLFDLFEKDGFPCCLLKGEGNASLYPNPLRRVAGDIDLWLDTDEATAYQYVQKQFPDEKGTRKHIHFPLFEDGQVDVHVMPLKFYSGIHSIRFRQWVAQNKADQFANTIRLHGTSRDICIPTVRFNAVYQLGHMLIHLLDEGMVLRQVVDYFYVLKHLAVTESERAELAGTIDSFGMMRFASAIMWIERDVLGLPAGQCIVEPNKRRGAKLLKDILEGGNFGEQRRKRRKGKGLYYTGLLAIWRYITLLPIAPREGIARICLKIRTAITKR